MVIGSITAIVLIDLAARSTDLHSVVSTVLSIGTFIAALVLARRQPAGQRWPSVAFAVAIGSFIIGATTRAATHQLGDLGTSRPLMPDLITLFGYASLTIALSGTARRNNRRLDLDALLDSLLVALSAFIAAWLFLISPTLALSDNPLGVRIALIAYPTLSMFLAAITIRLGFDRHRPGVWAFRLRIGSVIALLCGDVLYALRELSIINTSVIFLDAPYLIALSGLAISQALEPPAAPSAAVAPAASSSTDRSPLTRSRLTLVGLGLLIPPIAAASTAHSRPADRALILAVSAVMSLTAVTRVARALRAQAASQFELERRATHDDLTGLPNRSAVSEQISSIVERSVAARLVAAVLFVDVDRFKLVNDTFGHSFGDEFLTSIADRLRLVVRPIDVVARIGGDEFVVVVGELADDAAALAEAERLRRLFHQPFLVRGTEIPATASVGLVTVSHLADLDPEGLMRDADTAMYEAKRAGRDGVTLFDPKMRHEVAHRLALERELRHAISRGEITVAYQPIVSMTTGRIEGFEALSRWTHPTWGPVSPIDFISVAEETGMIDQIGSWVLDQACGQIGAWRRGLPEAGDCYVAVNLSIRQFHSEGLAEMVTGRLDAHDLPGSALHLELTESVLMENPGAVAEILEQIKRRGVEISIDDFGTGFSSLAYLNRLPVDRLKIDRAFVSKVAEDTTSAEESLIVAIIAMAAALGLSTVAEGVETQLQSNRIQQLGCDSGQGYLWARPAAADDIPALIAKFNDPRVRHAQFTAPRP